MLYGDSIGASIVGAHFYYGRGNVGILLGGETRKRDKSKSENKDGNYNGCNGVVNKENLLFLLVAPSVVWRELGSIDSDTMLSE